MRVVRQASKQENTAALSRSLRASALLPSLGSEGPWAAPQLTSEFPEGMWLSTPTARTLHAQKGAFSVPSLLPSELSFNEPCLQNGMG